MAARLLSQKLRFGASTTAQPATVIALNFVPVRFAGHSKWAKIARTKGANDKERAALFAKLSLSISAAARAGGTDPASNLRLQGAVEKARTQNCPKDVIQRAIDNAASRGEGMEEIVFEGMGPSNVAVVIETLTNKKARTSVGLKRIFHNHGAEGPGANGSVAFMFATRGRVTVPLVAAEDSKAQDSLLEAAMEAEAEDVEFLSPEDAAAVLDAPAPADPAEVVPRGLAYVWTVPTQVHNVRKAIEAAATANADAGYLKPSAAEIIRMPTTTVACSGEDEEAAIAAFIGDLEDHEDVQAVYHNCE